MTFVPRPHPSSSNQSKQSKVIPITIFGANTWTFTYLIGESPRVCSKYSKSITFYGFEAEKKLVRSRSNYFAHDGQRAFFAAILNI